MELGAFLRCFIMETNYILKIWYTYETSEDHFFKEKYFSSMNEIVKENEI